jgi:hypothetical protein
VTETNTLKTLGWIVSGFVAGFAVSQFLSKESIFAGSSVVQQCTTDQWQQLAKTSDWTPKNECPAYPLRLSITSPGNQTFITPSKGYPNEIMEKVIVNLSRPLPTGTRLYLAAQDTDSSNLYVSDESLYSNSNGIATTIGSSKFGFDISKTKSIQLWAFATNDDDRIGDLYKDIQQLQDGTPNVYVSEPIQLNVAQTSAPSE